jgi:hypothetical protein
MSRGGGGGGMQRIIVPGFQIAVVSVERATSTLQRKVVEGGARGFDVLHSICKS